MRSRLHHFANDPLAVAWALVNLAMAIGFAMAITRKRRAWAITAAAGFIASLAFIL